MPGNTDESAQAKLKATMVTDVGVVRDHNEDSAHVDPASQFFVVADGMGGHAAGEVASAMAVETVKKTLEGSRAKVHAFARKPTEDGRRELVQLLQNAVLAAHQAVFQRGARESDKQGMGTTLDVLLVAGAEAFVAHVGDSRTYLIRDERASQITTDHTVAEVLVIEGKLTIEEAQVSPLRTILVNAIGVSADVGVEMAHLQLRAGDRLLLCSDGLHDYFVAEQEIAERLGGAGESGPALAEMVELAKERGGHDNITGVVIDVIELTAASDGVPGVVEHDETLPVDTSGAPPPPTGWSDDENTENLTVKDLGDEPSTDRGALLRRAKTEPGVGVASADDVALRATAPMAAVAMPETAAPKTPAPAKPPAKPADPPPRQLHEETLPIPRADDDTIDAAAAGTDDDDDDDATRS